MKRSFALVLALAMLLLTACGGGGDSRQPQPGDADAGQDDGGTPPADSGERGADAEARRVVYMPYDMTEEFFVDVEEGVKNAAEALGWELITMNPDGDLNTQIQFFEDLQVQGVDGIIFTAIDGTAVGGAVEGLRNAGIFTVDFDVPVEDGNTDATVRSDEQRGGAMAAQVLGEALGGEGTVVVFEESPGLGAGMYRNMGFRAHMEENFPNVTIINNRPSDTTRDGCRAWTVDMLTAYPEAGGMFCYMGDAALGAYYGVKELGREDVVIMGYDASPEQQQIMIDDGPECQLIASVALYPVKYGRICVETLEAIFAGSYSRGGADDAVIVEPGLMMAAEAATFEQAE